MLALKITKLADGLVQNISEKLKKKNLKTDKYPNMRNDMCPNYIVID